MRKTLIAMLGLATLVVWALPALAGVSGDPPKAKAPRSLSDRPAVLGASARNGSYTATLSGTVVNQAAATTQWFMYPGVCQDRSTIPSSWAPKTTPVADSLNSYPIIPAGLQLGSYGREDLSKKEILWHKVASTVPVAERPGILAGSFSIWCGKFDTNWVVKVGYPNLTRQILYLDTGAHGGTTWNLTMKQNQSTEYAYDYVDLIGAQATDAMGNSGALYDEIIATGSAANLKHRVRWTGSIQSSTPGALSINATGATKVEVFGSGAGAPATIQPVIQLPSTDRWIYFVFTADCLYSSEDGLWPHGNGAIFDDITSSDTGVLFAEGTAAVGTDPFDGNIIQGTYGTVGYIAGRVTPGVGELWQIVDGFNYSTNDNCQPQKNGNAADHFFFGGDPSSKKPVGVPQGQYNAVVGCTFPVPVGTASIIAMYNEFLDLPRGSGFVQQSEYRFYKGGTWTNWQDTDAGGGVTTSVIKTWTFDFHDLAGAVQADSVQVRYMLQCIPFFSFDGRNCDATNIDFGILYDDLFLQVTSGVPAPLHGTFVGSVAQTTFVDGTMTGANCTTPPCWPGVRGSEVAETPGNTHIDVHNNFNSPLGDSCVTSLVTGLRKNGMGVNWKQGFKKTFEEGMTIAATNGSYNAAFDQPRIIYRLFDPATKTWSPFDSSALDANTVNISGADTILVDSEYRFDWPPRDKAGLSLPGGFTLGTLGGAYNNLAFLPRGTRMQYYFKAVDINGGTSYNFSTDNPAREVEDLPNLPNGGPKAPDIIEFDVLPRAYAPGSAGSLLAGRTDTPVLNLDGTYTTWAFQQDPMTQALRALGVRADRYRQLQGLGEANAIGGLELTGPPDNQRAGRGSNYFPNMTQYSIRDSLSRWYRIMIQSSHTHTSQDDEQDARLLEEWWASSTGTNGGDRCLFVSGDDYFNYTLNAPINDPSARRRSYGQNALGVNSAVGQWTGTTSTPYPTVEDRFANPGAGPGLLAGYSYPVDGGCPGPNRFDALTPMPAAQASAFYPGGAEVAGVAFSTERDPVADQDQNKSLSYGFSFQFVRKAGVPTNAANYVHSGVENRMQIIYKFLASCRGPRVGATSNCWPCPTDASLQGNWATLGGFQTSTYGPLYPIQDNLAVTGVELSDASAAPRVNKLDGNFPNPFNPMTTIHYSSAQAGKVTIRIFNVGGQLVRTLSTKAVEGANEVRWNGRRDDGQSLASGVYFYKVKFADGTESGSRMALVK